jgi:hypothetical protein
LLYWQRGWVYNPPHFMFEQVTLYPLHQLMSPFERGSTNFYGDVADVKVAARKDSNRKENHRLQQLAQQVRACLRGQLSGAHCRRRRRRRRRRKCKKIRIGATTFSIMTLSIVTFRIKRTSIIGLRVITLSILSFSVTAPNITNLIQLST